jgi:hypothetical protein
MMHQLHLILLLLEGTRSMQYCYSSIDNYYEIIIIFLMYYYLIHILLLC